MQPTKYFILIVATISLLPSSWAQNLPKPILEDLNGDQVVDTIISSYSQPGNGYGGTDCLIIDGRSNQAFRMGTHHCFCKIKMPLVISRELTLSQNKGFLERMKKEVLPKKREVPCPSLEWIISSTFSNKKIENKRYFDLKILPVVKWREGEIELPQTYYIDIKGDTLKKLHLSDINASPYERKESDLEDGKEYKGFLIYYGHNHFGSTRNLSLLASNHAYKAYASSHGVVVKKGKLHKWIFISDYDLTGAPSKLRWESVVDVRLIRGYAVITQRILGEGRNFFLVNIESGACGRLLDEQFINSDLEKMIQELDEPQN